MSPKLADRVDQKRGEVPGLRGSGALAASRQRFGVSYDFIPVAEETGLIVPIGWCVLRKACQRMTSWHREFPSIQPMSINVNLSSRQFLQPDLVDKISQVLEETGLETAKQLSTMRSLDCDYGQGFYISRPLDKIAAGDLIASGRRW